MNEITDKNLMRLLFKSLVNKPHIIIKIVETSGDITEGAVNGYVDSYELNGQVIKEGVEIHNSEGFFRVEVGNISSIFSPIQFAKHL